MMTGMDNVLALPAHGSVLLDARGDSRALRVSWHPEAGLVVLSLWRAGTCVGSFRLTRADVPALIDTLVRGLAIEHPDEQRTVPA